MDIDLLAYTKMIELISTKFPGHYRSDLINEGYLAILEAHKNYNPEKGLFEPYAKKWVYYAQLKFVSIDKLTNSLDVPVNDVEGETTTFKDLLEDNTDYEEVWENLDYYEKYMGECTQVEGFIKRKYHLDGLSVEQIIKLYSQWTHLTNPDSIYKILNLNKWKRK